MFTGCTFLFPFSYIRAQGTADADSGFYNKALANAMAVYHLGFGDQSALYNGGKYGAYQYRMQEGTPYFYDAQPSIGSVTYDGILYDSVLMEYDEVRDVVVINNQADWIQLIDKKVSYFKLHDAEFIRFEKDSAHSTLLSSGFYNRLYNGKTSLLKKQVKSIREVISPSLELQRFVDAKDFYYLQKDGAFFPIKKRKDFLNFFDSRKREVQQFIKTSKLNFRKDKENTLTKATAYYDSLNK